MNDPKFEPPSETTPEAAPTEGPLERSSEPAPHREGDAANETVEHLRLEAHEVVLQSHRFSSPFLPPDVLRAYNEVEPGLASKAVQLVVDEQKHRHERERAADRRDDQAMGTEADFRRRGQWFGITAVAMFSTVAVVGYATGQEAGATIFGSVVLVGLVTAFLGTRGRARTEPRLPAPDPSGDDEQASESDRAPQ